MTVVLAILGLLTLIVIHELGHMLTAKALGVEVTEFGVGFGPALFKKRFGKTIYSFRIILLGGFAKMKGMTAAGLGEEEEDEVGSGSYISKPPWRRALIIFAGPAVNIVTAVLIFAGLFMFVGGKPTTEVASVEQGTLAAEVGVEPGDEVVAVDGERVSGWEQFVNVVRNEKPGDEISFAVERNGQVERYSGSLSASQQDPDTPVVGVTPETTTYSPPVALWEGAKRTVEITGAYIGGLYQLATGQLNFRENVSGPVGIVTISGEAASQGFFIPFLAFLSLVLGIMNLLPILPLDGGHLLFIAAEKIRGRPVSEETVGKIALLGVILFISFAVFVTYTDISKLFTGQPFIPER